MKAHKPQSSWFTCFAKKTSHWSGSPYAFALASGIILTWIITGPMFGFSDTWQLVINTGTTIVTFLMVFLIQNTQNRDSAALQLKLDELIRATEGAHTVLLDLEELSDEELTIIRDKYERIAEIGRRKLRSGQPDTDIPEIELEEKHAKLHEL
ncbi:MAG: low affinity iron permease family protein [Proteobacteria bacterium]|nr:low affinity iron permease family protein [Pseudomonadota bacterium]